MTQMIEVKTAGLSEAALDWAVAKAVPQKHWPVVIGKKVMLDTDYEHIPYSPSTDWSHGGPLIDSWMVSLHCPQSTDDIWAGWVITDKGEFCQGGDTALIAACRAIVASKFGDTVQIPAELLP